MSPSKISDACFFPATTPVPKSSIPSLEHSSGTLVTESSQELFAAAEVQALKNCQRALEKSLGVPTPSESSADEQSDKSAVISHSPIDRHLTTPESLTFAERKEKFDSSLRTWVGEAPDNSYEKRRREKALALISECLNKRREPITLTPNELAPGALADTETPETLNQPIDLVRAPEAELLDLGSLYLDSLPPVDWSLLSHVTHLNLQNNHLTQLPEEMKKLENLQVLSLSYNNFTQLPGWLASLGKLTELLADHNFLSNLPGSFAEYKGRGLELSGNHFTKVPDCLLSNDSRLRCFLANNAIPLDKIPEKFLDECGLNKIQFKDLTQLAKRNNHNHTKTVTRVPVINETQEERQQHTLLNKITDNWTASEQCIDKSEGKKVAEKILNCSYLGGERLLLGDTHSVPENAIARLTQLKTISLLGSKIRKLPDEWQKLVNLTSLDIADTHLRELPIWLAKMPKLAVIHTEHCHLRTRANRNTKNRPGVSNEIREKFFSNYASENTLEDNQLAGLSDVEDFQLDRAKPEAREYTLSQDQVEAVESYTTMSRDQPDYKKLNSYLRSKKDNNDFKPDPQLEALTSACDSALKTLLAKGGCARELETLYRSVILPEKEIDMIQKAFASSKGYQPHQLFSCCSNPDFTYYIHFSRMAPQGEKNVFFVIRNSHRLAADIEAIVGIRQCIDEKIFPYETTFNVTKIKENGDFLQVDIEASDDLNAGLLASIKSRDILPPLN